MAALNLHGDAATWRGVLAVRFAEPGGALRTPTARTRRWLLPGVVLALAVVAVVALGAGRANAQVQGPAANAASHAASISRDLDADGRLERLVLVPAHALYLIHARQWAVIDRVAGKRVVRRIGPPGERLRRPRIADRNADGRPEMLIEWAAGNSPFFGEIWEWDGRRARLLWKMQLGPLFHYVDRSAPVNAPTHIAFPDFFDDGVREVEIGASVGSCRACSDQVHYTLYWRWSEPAHRWTFWQIELPGQFDV